MSQQAIDKSNADFWDTLCGSILAKQAGITGERDDDLARFDELYFSFYPYLEHYLDEPLQGKKVLEVGLGYGTLGQAIASRGADYHGVDIAAGPVSMMRRRLGLLGRSGEQVQQASVLDLPFSGETFDYVYSIGCLHHTGNLARSIDEVHRVLAPGGRAVVMLYYRHSFRYAVLRLHRLRARPADPDEWMRRKYDADPDGEAAPNVDLVSKPEARSFFDAFTKIRIDVQNFDDIRWGIKREWFLGNLAHVIGVDLYIVADK